jgi:hypothetical protein
VRSGEGEARKGEKREEERRVRKREERVYSIQHKL